MYIQKITTYKNKQDTFIMNLLKTHKYKLQFNKNIISVISNNTKLLIGNYILLGVYQFNTKLWIWASSIPGIKQEDLKIIQQIKQLYHIFENSNDKKNNFFYQLLTQDILLINKKYLLEWINELLLYFTKGVYYFNPVTTTGQIKFVILTNILEEYI